MTPNPRKDPGPSSPPACPPALYSRGYVARGPFPLSSDHLIHLIEYNVFRASLTNVHILSLFHVLHNPACGGYQLPDPPLFPRPSEAPEAPGEHVGVPESLRPTELQRTTPHGVWIDLLPSPRMRDNAIVAVQEGWLREGDLCGDVLKGMCGSVEVGNDDDDDDGEKEEEEEDKEEEEARIIVWSNPWEPAGWELTQGFSRKYGFLLKGCGDLLRATNRWREVRGDEPLVWEVDST